MQRELTVTIDSDVYKKFRMALALSGDDQDSVVNNLMRTYIADSFARAARDYRPQGTEDDWAAMSGFGGVSSNPDYGKALRRIPVWAHKPGQINHKIIRAFFLLKDELGTVSVEDLAALCGDASKPDTYVPTFKSNFAQMKVDSPKSHGKVFVENGGTVDIWDVVADVMKEEKHRFCI